MQRPSGLQCRALGTRRHLQQCPHGTPSACPSLPPKRLQAPCARTHSALSVYFSCPGPAPSIVFRSQTMRTVFIYTPCIIISTSARKKIGRYGRGARTEMGSWVMEGLNKNRHRHTGVPTPQSDPQPPNRLKPSRPHVSNTLFGPPTAPPPPLPGGGVRAAQGCR